MKSAMSKHLASERCKGTREREKPIKLPNCPKLMSKVDVPAQLGMHLDTHRTGTDFGFPMHMCVCVCVTNAWSARTLW